MRESANATGAFRNFVTSVGGAAATPGSASTSDRYSVTGTMPVSTAATAR